MKYWKLPRIKERFSNTKILSEYPYPYFIKHILLLYVNFLFVLNIKICMENIPKITRDLLISYELYFKP